MDQRKRERQMTVKSGLPEQQELHKASMAEGLSAKEIRLHLTHPGLIRVLEETDSTNLEARRLIAAGKAKGGDLVAACRQTAGRGRRGRSFFSPQGGLYMSVILQPEGGPEQSLLLTTAAAAAVYRAVLTVCGIRLDIKWVNDLYYRGKKICGILAEAVTDPDSGTIGYVVVGIGINLYLDPQTLPRELQPVAGALYDRREDLERLDISRLAAEIVNRLEDLSAVPSVPEDYISRNMVPGRRIRILDGERSRDALALSVCPDGRLKVREEDGRETCLSYGEVSVIVGKEDV